MTKKVKPSPELMKAFEVLLPEWQIFIWINDWQQEVPEGCFSFVHRFNGKEVEWYNHKLKKFVPSMFTAEMFKMEIENFSTVPMI